MATARPKFAGVLLAIAALAWTTAAGAQPFDHLKCYKIKDLAPKVKYTVDLSPEQTQFLAQSGCELKVPAKLFCIDTEKSNVAPAPPLVLNGQNTRDFLCYNLKCPALAELALNVEDQFGTRSIKVKKKPFQLCAPARMVGDPDPATPTPCQPPPTPIVTPTPVTPTCTDLTQNGGETDIDCGGPCPACLLGDGCLINNDCQSTVCTAGICTLCSPGQMQSCGTMLPGICALGTKTCLAGGNAYSACTGSPPQAETCNNLDDNCDGSVDNGLGQTTCGTGSCLNVVQNCVGGMNQPCTPFLPSPEICNALDDNCDGIVDNACPPLPNANGACVGPSCSYTCNAGYLDCNGNMLADGCEVNVQTDVNNCGGCGSVCSSNNGTRSCTAGTCQMVCNVGFANCNNNAQTDGCEVNTTSNNANCGGCGVVCPGVLTCVGSVCQ